LTSQLQQWCDAVLTIFVGSRVVDDVVDRVIASYENLATINLLEREEIRVKIGQYLETLSSAGHRDSEELTFYGLASVLWLFRRKSWWTRVGRLNQPLGSADLW
jgi:hypothetical protein